MGDRQYGYVVDEAFVLDDASLARVATFTERHLAENPARAGVGRVRHGLPFAPESVRQMLHEMGEGGRRSGNTRSGSSGGGTRGGSGSF